MEEKLNDLLILLCRGIANSRIYDSSHPKIQKHADEFISALQLFLRQTDATSLFIGIVDGNIVFHGCNLVGPGIIGRQLVSFANRLNCGGITFKEQVERQEVLTLLALASELDKPLETLQESRELLLSRGVVNIRIAYHYTRPSDLIPKDKQHIWQGKDSNQILRSPALIYQALFDVVSSAHGAAAEEKKIDLEATKSVSEYLLGYTRTNFSDMMQQIHYPDFDSYTVGHSVRVATLAVFVGTRLGLPESALLQLGTAGLLHDIGKSKIPQEILYKPGRLTAAEFELVKTHSRLGAEILLAQENTTELEISAAWGHHVRHDGGGYPAHPPWGNRQPLTALLQICDVFEALTAIRPYKPPMSPQAAYSLMLADQAAFHPQLLASFIATVGLYPPGNNVLLSDGSRATVLQAGEQIDRPTVKIIQAAHDSPFVQSEDMVLDLDDERYRQVAIADLLPD